MKKLNKKGFTIVELVIVIAVIAILAAVLIPTFSGVVDKAQKSARLQAAKNTYTEALIDQEDAALDTEAQVYILQGGKIYTFKMVSGVLTEQANPTAGTTLPTEASAAQKAIKTFTDTQGAIEISKADYDQLTKNDGYSLKSN